jgi:hypothetical protein
VGRKIGKFALSECESQTLNGALGVKLFSLRMGWRNGWCAFCRFCCQERGSGS